MAQSTTEKNYKYSKVLNEQSIQLEIFIEKKTYYLQEWLVSIIASMLILMNGLHYMWLAPILPALLNGTEKIHITTEESVLIYGSMNFGVIPGTICGAILADRYGRRLTLIWMAGLFALSGIISIFATSVNVLYLGRFLAGIAAGVSDPIVVVYCSEIASPQMRGVLLLVATSFLNLGMVVIYFIGIFLSYKMNTIVCSILPVIILMALFYIPESPYYLILKKNYDEAEKSLKFLRRRSNVQDELKGLKDGRSNDCSDKNSFISLFTVKTNLWALFVVCGLVTATELCGTNVLTQYCSIIFEKASSNIVSADIGGILQSIINFVVVFLCGCLIEKVGRRVLLLTSCILSVFPLMAIGIFFYFQEHHYPNIDNYSLVPFIGLTSLKFTVGLGIYCVPFIYIGELFPTNVKANASAICFIVISITNVLGTKMYQVLTDNFTYDIVFYVFAIVCIISGILFYNFVPETRGKTFEEIQEDLKKSVK